MKLKTTFLALSLALYTSSVGFTLAAGFEDTFKQAATAFKSGEFDKAGTLFEQAGDELSKKSADKAAQVWANAAVANIQAEDYKDAAAIYEKILSSKAKIDAAKKLSFYKNLIFCYGQLDERALQIKTVERALKDNKKLSKNDKAELQASAGDAYRDLELYRPAVNAYTEALKVTPKDNKEQRALILTAMGLCQGNLGDYQSAIDNLSEANKLAIGLKQDQTISDTYSNLGILNWEKGDYKQALSLLENALKVEEKAKFERNIGVDKNNTGLVYKSIGNYPLAMKLFDESIEIAKKIKNPRDEGIAVVNKALVYRILGQHAKANSEYSYAVSLFQQADFKEGLAGAYLGIGKMLEIGDNDYHGALDYYRKALGIYEDLEMPRGIAETLLQLGELYQKTMKDDLNVLESAQPKPTKEQAGLASAFNKYGGSGEDDTSSSSSTRDLSFKDKSANAPVEEKVSSGLIFVDEDAGKPLAETDEEAIGISRDYIERAFEIVSKMGIKELLWAAHQDLGFIDLKQGKLESAEQHYAQAIDIVSNIFVSGSDVETFGEYMSDKEELYKEAQAVCSLLYKQTNNQDYVFKIQKYGEMLNNEIQKASAALAKLEFEDPKKQDKYDQLAALQKKLAALEKSKPQVEDLPKDATAEQKALHDLKKKTAEAQTSAIKQVEADYNKAFEQWRKDYPNDTVLFDAASRVDIPTIQQNITKEQTVLMYTQLPENLLITVIKPDSVNCFNVEASKEKLDQIIRDDIFVNYIENNGRDLGEKSYDESAKLLADANKGFNELYRYYIAPIAKEIEGSKRLYIVNDGLAAQVPFGALVSGYEDNGDPIYLIEKYDIGVIRPSFIKAFSNAPARKDVKKMLAVANPYNPNFQMALLDGTIKEVSNVSKLIKANQNEMDIASEIKYEDTSDILAQQKFKQSFSDPSLIKRPTEEWVRTQLAEDGYEIMYFSTHGMPYSNVTSTLMAFERFIAKKNYDVDGLISKLKADPNYAGDKTYNSMSQWFRMLYTRDTHLTSNSPLNGFLYMSAERDDVNIIVEDVPLEKDGLLTMKEILQMPDSYFANTQYVFLSACNTGVTFVPAAIKEDLDQQASPAEVQKELEDLGLIPGVDQVSFVDSFMRRGVKNVYGTFWFVDDGMSAELLTRYMDNLTNEELGLDAVGAFNQAQRSIIADGKAKKVVIDKDLYKHPQHPYFWAAGGMFGK